MLLATVVLAFRKTPSAVVIDPLSTTYPVDSAFYAHWRVVNNGTVDYVGIFNLETYRKAKDKNSLLGNFSMVLGNYSKSVLNVNQSAQLVSRAYFIDGKYSTSLFYYLQAYGTHFYNDSESAAGYLEYYIPNRFGQNVKYEHNESELELLRFQALNMQWPSDAYTQIDDANYIAVYSGTVSMYSCPFKVYYKLQYAQKPRSQYEYPVDLDLQYRDFRDSGNSDTVDVVQLNATLVSNECAAYYVVEGETSNSAQMLLQSFIYALPMIIVTLLGIITAARLLNLSNSLLRAERISLASILLQTACDLVMAFYQVNSAIAVPHIHAHLLIVAANYFIMAVIFDITLLTYVYLARLANRGELPNPRTLCKIMMGSYLAFFVVFFLIYIIPYWGIFLLVTAASSYWFLQSLHAAMRGTPGKPLPLDYILAQTLCKYAPVIYFYSVEQNFMMYEILSWYPYVLWIWSGLQVFVILLQYVFGNRLGIKIKHKSDEKAYNYEMQVPSAMLLQDSNAFLTVNELVTAARSLNYDIFEYLRIQKYDFPIPFVARTSLLASSETDRFLGANAEAATPEAEQQFTETCMNALHRHSRLFREGLTQEDLVSEFPCLQRNCQGHLDNCFYLARKDDLAQFMVCPICIDAVRLDEIPNVEILQLYGAPGRNNDRELAHLRAARKNEEEPLYITPCGHCFHMKCIQAWASENAQCPVDRQRIPPCGGAVWYE